MRNFKTQTYFIYLKRPLDRPGSRRKRNIKMNFTKFTPTTAKYFDKKYNNYNNTTDFLCVSAFFGPS
jgi:hypothetical protein